MNLRRKTSIAVVLVMSLCCFGFRELFSRAVQREFQRAEETQLRQNAERLQALVDHGLKQLNIKAADWAFWDDTYNFLNSRSRNYIRSNLQVINLESLGVVQIAYWNLNKVLVHRMWRETGVNAASHLEQATEQLSKLVKENKRPLDLNFQRRGVIAASNRVYFYVMLPILTSERRGPGNGVMAFLQEIDSELLAGYSSLLRQPVRWVRFNLARSVPMFARAAQNLKNSPYALRRLSPDIAMSYYRLDDLNGKPALIIASVFNRTVYRQVATAKLLLDKFLLAASVVVTILLVLILDAAVLRRIRAVRKYLDHLADNPTPRSVFPGVGKDEFGRMIQELNEIQAILATLPLSVSAVEPPPEPTPPEFTDHAQIVQEVAAALAQCEQPSYPVFDLDYRARE